MNVPGVMEGTSRRPWAEERTPAEMSDKELDK